MTSRANHIRTQLQQASGDIRATWRTAQSLLHCRQKVIYDDSECADLVGKFSSFDKVRRIRDNIASALQQSSPGCSLHDRIPVPSYRISSRLLSTRSGKFPARFKSAQVVLQLKKAGLDRSLPVNYRPISNLSTVSKVLERLVLARLRPGDLTNSKNISKRQSAYRQGHSTETALFDVLDSVHTAADSKEVTCLLASISPQPTTRSVTRH